MKSPLFYRKFNYDKKLLPNKFLTTIESDVSNIEDAQKKSGLTIGYPGWGLIYHLLLSHFHENKKEVVIETGTNWGCTSIILAQALIDSGADGEVITFEIDQNNAKKAKDNFRKAGVSSIIKINCGDSKKLLPKAIKNIDSFRFAFLDGSHLFDDVLFEFETIYPKLTDDAIVIFDNTYNISEQSEDKRVFGALSYIHKKYGGNIINLEYVSWFTPGVAIWQKKSPFVT